jgi:hypothetical protein
MVRLVSYILLKYKYNEFTAAYTNYFYELI